MKKTDLQAVATKGDIEVAVAQITDAILKAVPSKDDHQRVEHKVNVLDKKVGELDKKVEQLDSKVGELDHKVDNLSSDVSDIRRRVIDLEHDTLTSSEFEALKKHVGFHYKPD